MRRGRIRGIPRVDIYKRQNFLNVSAPQFAKLHNPVAGGLRVSLACVVILLLVMDLHDFYTVNGK